MKSIGRRVILLLCPAVAILSGQDCCRAWTTTTTTITDRFNRRAHIQHKSVPLYSYTTFSYEIGGVTVPGTDPERPQKVNQDSHFNFSLQGSTNDECVMTVIGVMDGHGLKGHEVTRYLERQLPIRLRQNLGLTSGHDDDRMTADNDELCALLEKQKQDLLELANADPTELQETNEDVVAQALKKSFLAAQLDARRDDTVPTSRSGTTCVVCVVAEKEDSLIVYTANVGDSSAILACRNSNGMIVQPLTRATKVDMAAERKRIEGCQGRVDRSGNVFYGPIGIAMTRSLGDAVMMRAGVLPIPIVQRFEFAKIPVDASFDEPIYYVCAGSDGVFDVLSNEQVMKVIEETIATSDSLQSAAEEVCLQAKTAWLADLPIEPKVDDITCAVVKCSV